MVSGEWRVGRGRRAASIFTTRHSLFATRRVRRMQQIAFFGAEEEEAAVDEAEELLEVVVGGEGAVVEALAEGGVVRLGQEAAAEDEEGLGDAVAEAIADPEALGVAFGFPFFPNASVWGRVANGERRMGGR